MKKEIIKPFDLASYKNGAKVKTRDGHGRVGSRNV